MIPLALYRTERVKKNVEFDEKKGINISPNDSMESGS
jgi:hypothetical protein